MILIEPYIPGPCPIADHRVGTASWCVNDAPKAFLRGTAGLWFRRLSQGLPSDSPRPPFMTALFSASCGLSHVLPRAWRPALFAFRALSLGSLAALVGP